MKISLSIAAALITKISGYKINKDALRNQIVRGHWKYDVYKPDRAVFGESKNSCFLVEQEDAKEFARDFKGLSVGRPKSKHNRG